MGVSVWRIAEFLDYICKIEIDFSGFKIEIKIINVYKYFLFSEKKNGKY